MNPQLLAPPPNCDQFSRVLAAIASAPSKRGSSAKLPRFGKPRACWRIARRRCAAPDLPNAGKMNGLNSAVVAQVGALGNDSRGRTRRLEQEIEARRSDDPRLLNLLNAAWEREQRLAALAAALTKNSGRAALKCADERLTQARARLQERMTLAADLLGTRLGGKLSEQPPRLADLLAEAENGELCLRDLASSLGR